MASLVLVDNLCSTDTSLSFSFFFSPPDAKGAYQDIGGMVLNLGPKFGFVSYTPRSRLDFYPVPSEDETEEEEEKEEQEEIVQG